MTIKTLEHTSIDSILEVFNHSFSDYLIPMHLKIEQLNTKIITENIQLHYSIGAFDGDQLVGFILHGWDADKGIVYNGGTGVIPSHRGHGLTQDMYSFILPRLKMNKIKHAVLEVISNNIPAIKSYEKIGFKKVRELQCYRGILSLDEAKDSIEIRELVDYPWEDLEPFWEVLPAWQYNRQSMDLSRESHSLFGAFVNKELIAYAIVNLTSHRLNQIAVSKEYRRSGAATTLLHVINAKEKEVQNHSMINVDATSQSLNSFLVHCGLKQFLTQHEMKFSFG